MVQAACTQLKLQGNAFYKKKDFARAIEAYNGALIGMPEEAAIYSNRSVCYLKEKEYDKSLADAETCIKLMPEWFVLFFVCLFVLYFFFVYFEGQRDGIDMVKR
jgi:tetratricopeptide (TPR) repeat protein